MSERNLQAQLSAMIKEERRQAYDEGYKDGYDTILKDIQAILANLTKAKSVRRGRPPKTPVPSERPSRGRPPKTPTTKTRAPRGQVRTTVIKAVSQLGKEGAGATEIKKHASTLAGLELSISSVHATLSNLLKEGQIGKTGTKWHPIAKPTAKSEPAPA